MFGAKILSQVVINQKRLLSTSFSKHINFYSTRADEIFSRQLKKLKDEKVSEPENSLELIFAHVLEKKKLREVRGDELKKYKLTDEQVATVEAMSNCRLSRMPVQYILKEWEFRDVLLKMQIPVLIPRVETEELVELITQQLEPEKDLKILEVGCGTWLHKLELVESFAICQKNCCH